VSQDSYFICLKLRDARGITWNFILSHTRRLVTALHALWDCLCR